MKRFDRVFIIGIVGFILVILGVNVLFQKQDFSDSSREYRVSLNRIEQAINAYEEREGTAPECLEDLYRAEGLSQNTSIIDMDKIDANQENEALDKLVSEENADYYLVVTDKYIYKITYQSSDAANSKAIFYVNLVFVILFIAVLIVYLYLRNNILKPFNQFSELPYELAKGNMNKPLEESKNKYFGRFIWGMNMLRENLEESKARELEVQKDKKMLLLSLSHDIKTPLNAISLYAKAISKNLYKDEARKQEVAENINVKVDEIESYISDIVKASSEDFLTFEVNNTEVYTGGVLDFISDYYKDKTALNNIDFIVGEYQNCLVNADNDRLIEVIQNIVENAIKYGDGRKIWINTEKNPEEYIISVRNTGCKLPDNELSHIFDSFFRGTNVENKNGSGLGLYICRQLMHLMEGEVLAGIISEADERIMEIKVILKML